jgi:tetratricopeptide (TPR) repeat protein
MDVEQKLEAALKCHSEGKKAEAIQLYQDILKKQPKHAHALHYLGLLAADNGQLEQARQLLTQSLVLKPNLPAFNHNIAGFFSRMGDIEAAIQHFTKAINLKPDYAEAYQGLSECTKIATTSDIFSSLTNQLNNPKLTNTDKSYLHFAAAKTEADSKNFDAAFHHYELGNQYKHAVFDVAQYQTFISDLKTLFTQDFCKIRRDWGLFSQQPIFIIGMPRSGTTLLEQIISSHSQVFGAGELNDISFIIKTLETRLKKPYPQCLNDIRFNDVIGFAMEYRNRLNQISNNSPFVVNKHPLNFKYLGFILLMFPNAKIIHARRDPIDTCLSCFCQNFTKGQEYSFNLEHLGHFYNGYTDLMAHWQSLFGDQVLDIQYEDLVAAPETQIKRLLEHCDLEWEEACLSPHTTDRPVATASKYQVRQPLYATSVKKWQRYEQHLQPLIQIINSNSF